MKFVWIDDWYGAAYEQWAAVRGPWLHGTADFWDLALRDADHESDTHILNMHADPVDVAVRDKPDVVCVQNVGRWPPHYLRPRFPAGTKFVAFCSYAASRDNLTGWDCVFTSFPWLADELNAAGLRAEFLPLAFGRQVLTRVPYSGPRDIPVAFVGGLGLRVWERGTLLVAHLCGNVPDFKWWGYYHGDPREYPVEIQEKYQGPAWGADYWKILQRAEVVINRHGEIAKGFGNNMRQYESLGCGAVLITDDWGELQENPFVFKYEAYDSAQQVLNLIDATRGFLGRRENPKAGQEHILANHCYEHRVPRFLEVINSL